MADSKIPIALQLYSVRKECAKDLPGTLKAIAEMGYEGVEFAGFFDYSASDLKKMLADNGLKVAGSHTPLAAVQGDELAKTAEFNLTFGNPYLIVPWLPEEMHDTRENWEKTADLFNEISANAKKHHVHLGYHNHYFEFEKFADDYIWDIFFSRTNDEVIMQLDSGNALKGGAEIAPFLKRYPGRATTVHLKEYAKDESTVNIGDGDVEWDEIFQLCETVGATKWYIVEQENYAQPPMECVKICLDNLRKMGK